MNIPLAHKRKRDEFLKLSKHELKLLRLLHEDSARSLDDIAIGLGAWFNRQKVGRLKKKLEEAGVIRGYGAKLDRSKIGLPVTVYTLITLKSHGDGRAGEFERCIRERFPYIVECARISGSWDYMAKFVVRSTEHYDQLHSMLLALPDVSRVRGHHAIGLPEAMPMPIPTQL